MQRICKIVGGSIELENGAGDGAYSLLDLDGTPKVIGMAIADCLADCDMMQGCSSLLEGGIDLYLNIRIKITPIVPHTDTAKSIGTEEIAQPDVVMQGRNWLRRD